MAGAPSAVLSVEVTANADKATAVLTKYDKQLQAVNAESKKGIEARLGANYNPAAFKAYEDALDKAALKAKNRGAFKAELGANFNNRAFTQYQRALEKANAESEETSAKTSKLGVAGGAAAGRITAAAKAIGLGAIAVGTLGAVSIKAAASFQKGMEMIHTQAGASQKEVDSLSKSVLKLSGSVATSPEKLTEGLFHLESQGLRGAKAMDALRVAAEGAKVGNADLEDVTNALGAAVVSGVKGTSNLDKAMGSLNATVGAGDMHLQDLADAFGTGLLGPMKQFGVNLQDIDAALATFGDNNIRGADAGTKLGSAIRIMAAPSDAAAKKLGSIGISATKLANDLRSGPGGLVKAITDLKTHLEDSGKTASQQARVLAQAFGGRQSTGVQLLLGQLDRLKTKEKEVGEGATSFASEWQATKKTLSTQFDQIVANIEHVGIIIGNAIGPPILKALTTASDATMKFVAQIQSGRGAGGTFAAIMSQVWIVIKNIAGAAKDAATWVGSMFTQFQKGSPVVVATTGAIAGAAAAVVVLTTALKAATAAQTAFDIVAAFVDPYIAVAAAIGAVAGAMVLLYLKVKTARDIMNQAWMQIKNVGITAFDALKTYIVGWVNVIKGVIQVFKGVLTGNFGQAWDGVKKIFTGAAGVLLGILKGLTAPIRVVAKGIGSAIHDPMWTAVQAVTVIFKGLKDIVGGVFTYIKNKAVNAITTVLGAFKLLLDGIAKVADAGSGIPLIGKLFGHVGSTAGDAADSIQGMIDKLNGIPTHKSTEVDVNMKFASNIAGSINSIAQNVGGAISNVGNRVAGGQNSSSNTTPGQFFTGGVVDRPGYFAGEEAPRHPEVILATNPAYRQRNLGLFAKAGSMLGVPGFAQGGIAGAGPEVASIDPQTAFAADKWAAPRANAYGKKIAAAYAAMTSGGTGPAPLFGPAGVQRMISKANEIASHGYNYEWGGGHSSSFTPAHGEGHGSGPGIGYDCSGAVSAVLHADGLLASPMVSGGFMDPWGQAGPGKFISVYASPSHTFMKIGSRYFGTSSQNKGGGASWIPSFPGNIGGPRHPPGFAKGGIVGGSGWAFDPSQMNERNQEIYKRNKLLPGYAKGGIFGKAKAAIAKIPGFLKGGVYTASDYNSHGTGAGGLVGDVQSVPGFAELSHDYQDGVNADFSALGHLPFGSKINVTYGGKTITIPKLDVGAGGPGLNGHLRAVDLTMPAARELNFPGLADVLVSAAGRTPGSSAGGATVKTTIPGIGSVSVPNSVNPSSIGKGKPKPKFIATPIPKLKMPFSLPEPTKIDKSIDGGMRTLSGILGQNTGVAKLSDFLTSQSAIDDQRNTEYAAAHPGLDTTTGLVTPAAGGAESPDWNYVAMRVKQLQAYHAWQAQLVAALKRALRMIDRITKKIKRAMAARKQFIASIQRKITENLEKISELQNAKKKKGATRRDKSNDDAFIKAIENQNKGLGGQALRVGSGGIIGQILGENKTFDTRLGTLASDKISITGPSGIGGTLGQAKIDLQNYTDQLTAFGSRSVLAAVNAANATIGSDGGSIADTGGDASSQDNSQTIAMMQQLLDRAHLATSVSQNQFATLNQFEKTPPFGGRFAAGGVVPGATGAAKVIVAHGGETVLRANESGGDTHVHLNVAPGMEWLKQFISVEVNQNTKNQARNAGRRLASAGGGRTFR